MPPPAPHRSVAGWLEEGGGAGAGGGRRGDWQGRASPLFDGFDGVRIGVAGGRCGGGHYDGCAHEWGEGGGSRS